VYVNAASGITQPEHLAGRRVGVPDYAMTAAVWIRAFLRRDHGVAPDAVRWVCAAPLEGDPHPSVSIDIAPDGQPLEALLERGEIDALIGARPPAAFARGETSVRRLFSDHTAVEREYVGRLGYLPIMHLVVLRRRVYQARPELARGLYATFEAAQADGVRRLRHLDELALSDPWWEHRLEEMDALAGPGMWAYGVEPNRAALAALTSHVHEQGLSARAVSVGELFAPEFRKDAA
jgi:4,5-dihydroxyphthalate decarboxylase